MKDKIVFIIVILVSIVFSISLEKSILKLKKFIPPEQIKSLVKNINIFSIFLLISLIIYFLFLLKREKKSLDNDYYDPLIIKLSKEFSKREKELKEKGLNVEKKLKSMLEILTLILESETIGIIVVDENRRVLFSNKTAGKILGFSVIPVMSDISNYINLASEDEIAKIFNGARTKNGISVEFEKEEKVILVHVFYGEKKAVFILRDITELKEAQKIEELKKEQKALREMARFLAHEVKNSAGIILGYSKLIKNSKNIEKIEKIKDEASNLINSVDKYLKLWRPVEINLEEVKLGEVLNTLYEEFSGMLNFELKGKDCKVLADKELLYYVFKNLIKNSYEASSKSVRIECKTLEKKVEITYTDDGDGISEENIKNIFLPFFTTKSGGSGMGLAFSKKFIVEMGGSIFAVSREKGVEFKIILKSP